MNDRRAIARQAMVAALRTRLSAGYGLEHAVCVYDLAEKLGVEVRFLDLPSMEGMYSSTASPTIIVSSLRPPGRRAFTCAHELGHHNRSNAVEIDELVEQWDRPRFDPREFAADCFAGALLMPKMAVSRAFAIRGWSMEDCTPEQAFMVAGYFSVGYTTLVHHLRSALQGPIGHTGPGAAKGQSSARLSRCSWDGRRHRPSSWWTPTGPGGL